MSSQLKQIVDTIIPVLKTYQVKKAGLFGSVLREDYVPESDIDLLIEMKDSEALKKYFDLKFALEEKLNRNVDLVEYSKLHPRITQEVVNNQLVILP